MTRIYDLKGSKFSRYTEPNKVSSVLKDNNFM